MSAHTPGPWTLETVPTQVGLCHKIGPFPKSRGYGDTTYACVYVDGLGLRAEDSPELLANAQLMKAAPDLLRALREIRDGFDCKCDDVPDSSAPCQACVATNAIERAEGRS